MNRVATIYYTRDGIAIASPWSAAFLDELKAYVPSFARTWEPKQRQWIISSSWVVVALEVTKQHFRVVEVNSQTTRDTGSGAYAELHLLPSAPPELIKAAYRCLALLYHPDHGGDVERMQRLIAAYGELKK